MKNRRELLKTLPFLAAIPFVRIPNSGHEFELLEHPTLPPEIAEHLDIYPPREPLFSFRSPVRELHSTPAGLIIQTDEGIYQIFGGPDPRMMYVQMICNAPYEDVRLRFHNDYPTGVQKRENPGQSR